MYLLKGSKSRVTEAGGLTVGTELNEMKQQFQMAWQRRLSRAMTLTEQAKSRQTNLRDKLDSLFFFSYERPHQSTGQPYLLISMVHSSGKEISK